jgi:hypothetical protein
MARVEGFNVSNWALGYGHETDRHFLKLDFTDGKSITLSLLPNQAKEMAQALLKQLRQKPPKPDRLS